MVDLAPRIADQADAPAVSATRRYYVLALLTAIYALNFLDRTIFNVLIEPIKKEFALSDTTMGLLAGFGFVLAVAEHSESGNEDDCRAGIAKRGRVRRGEGMVIGAILVAVFDE